ncbi:hypothetical protein HZS_6337 [Henneguya salminicola]|nr:hypothetical protein HZS_6337 [Henneguya salminicola]
MTQTTEIKSDGSVFVAIRIRPQNESDLNENCCNITEVVNKKSIRIKNSEYEFDRVYDMDSMQIQLFNELAKPLVDKCLGGFNAAIFAYGQTGSGKTYTMGTSYNETVIEETVGLIPRTISYLFEEIKILQTSGAAINVSVQFLELYNEDIFDLLDTKNRGFKNIKIHETVSGDIHVQNCSIQSVSSCKDVLQKLTEGTRSRTTASTNMNIQSSRSHAIFTLIVSQKKHESNELSVKKLSKFHLVDLAGSERLSRTGAVGDRAKEAISINSGLLALGNVINALGDKCKRGHVPYRDSKLTRLLQDSLGGNSYTIMNACISPSDRDMSETISTLNYAIRAKNIKNKISINQQISHKKTSKLINEIKILREQLNKHNENLKYYKEKCNFYEIKYGLEPSINVNTYSNVPLEVELSEPLANVLQVSPDTDPLNVAIVHDDFSSHSNGEDIKSSLSMEFDTPDLFDKFETDVFWEDQEPNNDLDQKMNTQQMQEGLIEVTTNIAMKEDLEKELESRKREFEEMREHYEQQIESLHNKIETLSKKELEDIEIYKKQTNNSDGIEEIKKSYFDKIRTLKDELKAVRAQQQSYHHKVVEKEQVDRQLNTLKKELQDLKHTKVSLTRALSKEISTAQKKQMDYMRKLKAAEKDATKKDIRIKTLTHEMEKTNNVLKRKYEELGVVRRQIRQQNPRTNTESMPSLPKPILESNVNKTFVVPHDKSESSLRSEPTTQTPTTYRPLCLLESPAISFETKNKWKIIEEQVNNLLVKKETLTIMNKEIDKLIRQRTEVSHEILSAKKKLETCPKRMIKKTQEKIKNLEETLESLQKSIENDQKEIADLEIDDIVNKNIKVKELELEKKIPRKRVKNKNIIEEPDLINSNKVHPFDNINQRRKTALPTELTKSLLATPLGARKNEETSPVEVRRVTRNMSKGIIDTVKTESSTGSGRNSQENDFVQKEIKENIPTKKRHLLNLETDLYKVT